IVPANFYSTVPLVDDVRDSFEYRAAECGPYEEPGVFDVERMRAFLAEIRAYGEEFEAPVDGDRDAPEDFFWSNPAFSYTDALAYYCVLRHAQPDQVLEIGSGFSTLVADRALRRNGHGRIVSIEPFPKPFLRRLPTVASIVERRVQDLPLDELLELVEGSGVWFIDSTHTVKCGSDCLYIYLKAMPRVTRELLVHSHDVFLPFAPPQSLALDKQIYWTEQYLLHAFLLNNPRAEVLFGSAWALARLRPEIEAWMAGRYPPGGGSLWYRLNPRPAP